MKLHLAILIAALSAASALGQTTMPTATTQAASYERYRVVSEPGEVVTTLTNGMTIIAKRVATPVVAVRGYVKTGGVYEGPWLGGGLSHLLEHLVAGGSSRNRTEAENRTILQEIGNNSNAYTTDDHTAYFINTTPQHFEKAVDLLTGWLLGAKITEDEYRREYQVVQRELEMGKGEPDRQFYMLAQSNRYLVSPARVPTIGFQPVIENLSRDDVYAYYQLAYQPQNIVMSVAGDMDPEQMVAIVARYVGDAPPGREFSQDIPAEPPVLTPRTVVATAPKLGQAKLSLAFPTVRLDHPDLYALDLLSTCLTNGESAILVRTLRDDLKLVSSIDSWSATPTYVEGSFSISSELDVDKIGEATKSILDGLERVKTEGVDADTLARAKTQMKVSRIRGNETAERIASTLAQDLMSTGDPHFTDRYLERIDKVTVDQIKAVASAYFVKDRLITTAMLPEESAPNGLPSAVDVLRQEAPTTNPVASDTVDEGKVVKSVLENGTVLLTKQIASSPVVSIRMYTTGGLTAEDVATNGLGNLTMRMLPRGTTTRSAREIASFFDRIGGEIATVSGSNTFSWQASCLKADLPKVMEVFADIVQNPVFDAKELAAMKIRQVAAIDSQDSDWTSQAFRYFKKQFYGPKNSPYQFTALGTKENLTAFDSAKVRQWYASKALTGPRVLAIYGDVSASDANALASKYFNGNGPAFEPRNQRTTLTPIVGVQKIPLERAIKLAGEMDRRADMPGESKPSVDVIRVDVQQSQQPLAGIVIGFESASVFGMSDTAAIDVGDTMASGSSFPTGYLHETLRGQGLVYVVHAMNSPGRSAEFPGSFIVYAGCDPKAVNEVTEQILLNIARLQGSDEDMQPGWIDRAKQLMIIDEAMDRQTAAQQAESAALNELYGLGYSFTDRFAERTNAVNADAVRSVAASRLSRCVVTISTPNPELVKVTAGERTFKSFPQVDLTPKGVTHDAGTP